MEPVNLLLVGCGMMGARHVRGLGELERVTPGSLRLGAVCDRREDLAVAVADEAQELLGARPAVFTDVEDALREVPDLQAADVVTDPRSHDALVGGLLQTGLDIICEKPLALTIARGRRMIDVARQYGRVLATAENNRWDPMNRLGRACINGGLIGRPNFVLQVATIPVDRIIATAWRHRLAMGGLLLDVAIHGGYMLEYLLGPVDAVCAQAQLSCTHRQGAGYDGQHVEVEVDAEDCFSALLEFGAGAQGSWTGHFATPGHTPSQRVIFGDEGTIICPPGRSGQPVEIRRGADTLKGDDLVAQAPGYQLSEMETRLFGDRPGSYSLEATVTDRKLIAAEMDDFLTAVRERGEPEADGATGLRAVAFIYAILESALARRPVTLEEILGGSLHAYQDMVEAAQ